MTYDNDPMFSFEDLVVWQRSVEFTEKTVTMIDQMKTPRRHYRMIEQLEAAATSLAMNIAEGKGRQTDKEFVQFLYIARGSLFEVITLLVIFARVGWVDIECVQRLRKPAEEIVKMLNSLIKSLRAKP